MRRWLARWPLLLLSTLACTPSAPVAVQFHAVVGARPFVCGARYDGVGKPGAALSFSDLRMYVSKPRLIEAGGRERPLHLTPDAQQSEHIALLDFANAARGCGPDAGPISRVLRGVAATGSITGIAFELGVPFDDNHQDLAAARAPLNVSSMFWVWRHGYKFLRVEAAQPDAPALSVHVGSTGCTGEAPTDSPARCTHPNRAHVRLDGFDPRRDGVDFDVGALLADLTLPADRADGGCESAPDDPDCEGVFDALGLSGTRLQRAFRVRKGPR